MNLEKDSHLITRGMIMNLEKDSHLIKGNGGE
jgi:hypothetical protein